MPPRWVARSGSLMALLQKRRGQKPGTFSVILDDRNTNPIITPLNRLQEQCRRVADVFEACLAHKNCCGLWLIMAYHGHDDTRRFGKKTYQKGHYMSTRQWS